MKYMPEIKVILLTSQCTTGEDVFITCRYEGEFQAKPLADAESALFEASEVWKDVWNSS